jgi:BolA protein
MSVQSIIERKLMDALKPSHLEVINESYMHNVPRGSESHFKVVVVSDMFETMSLIQRHRAVNDILKEELAGTIHALSIQAKTIEQWEKSGHNISQSPRCLGGGRK